MKTSKPVGIFPGVSRWHRHHSGLALHPLPEGDVSSMYHRQIIRCIATVFRMLTNTVVFYPRVSALLILSRPCSEQACWPLFYCSKTGCRLKQHLWLTLAQLPYLFRCYRCLSTIPTLPPLRPFLSTSALLFIRLGAHVVREPWLLQRQGGTAVRVLVSLWSTWLDNARFTMCWQGFKGSQGGEVSMARSR